MKHLKVGFLVVVLAGFIAFESTSLATNPYDPGEPDTVWIGENGRAFGVRLTNTGSPVGHYSGRMNETVGTVLIAGAECRSWRAKLPRC